MKKVIWLLGLMILSVASINADNVYPGGLTEEQRQKIEEVQWKKGERQRELARPEVYKMLDAAIKEEMAGVYHGEMLMAKPIIVNWALVFNILDSMRGVISVNEYRTYDGNYPLIFVAVKEGNAVAAKTLLEKYKANPNATGFEYPPTLSELQAGKGAEMTPLMLARKQGDNGMVNLLIRYGAKDPMAHLYSKYGARE